MPNTLLEFANTKPEPKQLWKAIEDHTQFDAKANPFQAKVTAWIAMQLTTNFPASKTEVQKFLDGATTLQTLMDGLAKSINEKYKVKLDFTKIKNLEHQNRMHSPSPELRTVYTAIKTTLTKDHVKIDVLNLLNKLFTNNGYIDQDIQESIYTPFQPTAFTVQTRFDEMTTDDAFRIYFKSTNTTDSIPDIVVSSRLSLRKNLKDRFLANLIDTDQPYCTLNCNYRMEH